MRRPVPKDAIDVISTHRKKIRKLELRGTGLWTPHVAVYNTTRARAELDLPSTWTVESGGGGLQIWYHPDGEISLSGLVKGTWANLATVDGNFGLILQNIPSAPECGTSGNAPARRQFVAPAYDFTALALTTAYLSVESHPVTSAGTANLRVETYSNTRQFWLDSIRWMPDLMASGDPSDWPEHTIDWP